MHVQFDKYKFVVSGVVSRYGRERGGRTRPVGEVRAGSARGGASACVGAGQLGTDRLVGVGRVRRTRDGTACRLGRCRTGQARRVGGAWLGAVRADMGSRPGVDCTGMERYGLASRRAYPPCYGVFSSINQVCQAVTRTASPHGAGARPQALLGGASCRACPYLRRRGSGSASRGGRGRR